MQLARTKPLQATEVHAQLVLLVSTAASLDRQLKEQPARTPVLLATPHRLQARPSLQSALFAPLAMEAPQCRILDQPLADALFAQLAFSKLLQATLFAQLVPTATQALSQEVLLPHLAVSVLPAILVV